MSNYIITDWANNRLFGDKQFKTEEEAFDFLYEIVEEDVEDYIVCEGKDFIPTVLDTIDLLENRSYRAQL